MMHLLQLPWGFTMALVAALQVSATPLVNIGLGAAFPAGPYLLELLEMAAEENATAYFPLLDRIATGHFASAASDADLYNAFLDTLQQDGHITSPEALSTFNLALSLRSASPRIEAHYQYYLTAVEPIVGEQSDADCSNWILFEDHQYCDPLLKTPTKEASLSAQIKNLPFDRTMGAGKEAVLYADPTSATFKNFHLTLYQAAQKGQLSYRLRYRRTPGASGTPVPVSGYGVELALKRTDYIVIDDRDEHQDSSQRPLGADVVLDEEEEVADLKPLSTSELASLGMKAASFILQNEHPFETLVKLTQDFPKFSASIAAHDVSNDFAKEHEERTAQMIPGGINYLWMNGVQLIERQIQPFALVEMVRRERKLINGVRDLGFNGKEAISLLGHKKVAAAKSDDEPPRFDWTDRLEDGKAVIWLNDLEHDETYAEFSKTLSSLLQRTYPGQLPSIAKNIFHLVLPVDFSQPGDISIVTQLWNLITMQAMPLRLGVVPLTSTAEAATQAGIAYHLSESYTAQGLATYLVAFADPARVISSEELFTQTVETLNDIAESEETKMALAEVLAAEVNSQRVKLAGHWTKRLAVDSSTPYVFVNGLLIPREKGWMQTVFMRLSGDIQTVQGALYRGLIDEDTWVPGVFLEKATSRRNAYITPEDDKALRILDVNKISSEHADLFDRVPVVESYSDSTKENWAVLTVIADLGSSSGLDLLLNALSFKRNNPGVRLDIVHNAATSDDASKLNNALKSNENKLHDMETLEELSACLETPDASEGTGYTEALTSFLSMAKILPGSHVLILNGRIVGPISPDDLFTEDDFQQLLEVEQTSRILPVYAAIDDLGLTAKLSGPISAAKITSITALSTISELPEGIFESTPSMRTTYYDTWNSTHSTIEVGDPETASIHVAGLLNPASEQGQRWAPILKVLSELDGVYLKLFLNPREKIEELPVKSFFRYVVDSKPSFDEDGSVKALNATFKGLPSEALLTASMNVPPAWLVAPKSSIHDLDNIKLSSLKSDVEAMYELEHILIEGHSREGSKGSPPRGARLDLSTAKEPLVTDTMIMSNLGFFQFKANPGFYNIQLKEGRSADIYTIESIGAHGWAPVPGDENTDVALMDFQGTTLYPRLQRKPGMEAVDVLEEADASDDNIVSRGLKFAESLLGGSKQTSKSVSAQEHADINIFSVASGHLYERMLNIMMVSVMRHTKHTVKFWFIEQFLSPSFKDFIPHMAAEYGFKYEMVTYKWPHWLRQQKEKQREIWGYKILFLDVLFPQSLDKVIFVDADQIVRTDMMDLVSLDLEGAPYGFTPMCDSRTEMEGFRFWKQGYWDTYLRGRPYHISALYVVDLRRFRELAAGDRLRQQYHALSADPGSLANLDQDLPNHMQFQIPIHSLSQEWLWCETWCSDESLADARTIDLCNNPLTKEPKLDRARRQVPEWTVYDDEIAALDRRRKDVAQEDKGRGEMSDGVNTKSRRFEEEPAHTKKDEL